MRLTPRLLSASRLLCAELHNRTLLCLKGPDTLPFLKGLITNDTRLFEKGHMHSIGKFQPPIKAMYSMILNEEGRILHDILMYNMSLDSDVQVYIDCHVSSATDIESILKTYRMRRNVQIEQMGDKLAVYAFFREVSPSLIPPGSKQLDPQSVSGEAPTFQAEPVFAEVDPRVAELGWRIAVQKSTNHPKVSADICSSDHYDRLRYQLGVHEGPIDCPPGKALPLEYNVTDLNGISFDKGCYIGQELTARTHHTGVVRKRLLPVVFNDEQALKLAKHGAKIVNENAVNVGQFRNSPESGVVGLALLRVKEALGSKSLALDLNSGSGHLIPCRTYQPFWCNIDSSHQTSTS